jgi:hypothetical protein
MQSGANLPERLRLAREIANAAGNFSGKSVSSTMKANHEVIASV